MFKTGVLAIIGLHGGPYSLHLKISVPKSWKISLCDFICRSPLLKMQENDLSQYYYFLKFCYRKGDCQSI